MNSHGKIEYYKLSAEETLQNLKSAENGLSEIDAISRLKLYGQNKLIAAKKETFFAKFLRQFKDAMVIILIVAGGVSIYLQEYRDATILFVIVLVNAGIGFIQEYKAEKVLDSLKTLIKAKAKVIRNGNTVEVNQEDIAPGDIIKLEEGDAVPADLRIIDENYLSTNDFALTGESNPTKKFIHAIQGDVQLQDRNNIAFMGTTVATGNGLGVVIGTGMDTVIGNIANLSLKTRTALSPLQKELNHLAKTLTKVTLSIGIILLFVGLAMKFNLREALLFALGIAAACVPEGLPAQISVALSLAAGRLAKKKAIIKKLSSVETLGSTHIICTDKTGTLTKNEMTVQKILLGLDEFNITGSGYKPEGKIVHSDGSPLNDYEIEQNKLFFLTGILASNASINPPDEEHLNWYSLGDPTEAALITLSEKAGFKAKELREKHEEHHQFTFDANRKLMSSIRTLNGDNYVLVKGSPQSIIERCTHIKKNGEILEISDSDKKQITGKDDEYASEALRVLAYAYKKIEKGKKDISMEEAENNLIFLGLAAMIDPPREEVQEAIDIAEKGHIRVIIITGDYALTATAIAKKIGVGKEGKPITVINGIDLQSMSDIDLLHNLIHENLIFSRTSPEDKLRIVGLLKKAGEIVAVTGDGVNDAPALKKADIGVAMGKTGTEVAKESSEIILLDDSFGTLVSAIKEGRTIFHNLRKTIMSSMTSNGGELFVVIFSLIGTIVFGLPMAILAIQILAIDLVGEMLPLTFLTWDPAHPKIMEEAPRNPHIHIVNKKSLFDLLWSGALMGLVGYANFVLLYLRENVPLHNVDFTDPFYMRATALTYVSIVLTQWLNIFSRHAGLSESVFSSYAFANKRLLIGYGISLVLILNIVYNPFIAQYLHTKPLTLADWGFALLGACVYLSAREIRKLILRKKALLAEDAVD
jgi:Ca2+-transporting ATPase